MFCRHRPKHSRSNPSVQQGCLTTNSHNPSTHYMNCLTNCRYKIPHMHEWNGNYRENTVGFINNWNTPPHNPRVEKGYNQLKIHISYVWTLRYWNISVPISICLIVRQGVMGPSFLVFWDEAVVACACRIHEQNVVDTTIPSHSYLVRYMRTTICIYYHIFPLFSHHQNKINLHE